MNLIFDPIPERKAEFLFQTEKTFCKTDPENEIDTKSFNYDRNGNLIETTNSHHGIQDSKNTSTFDVNNQRLTDSTFYFTESGWEYSTSKQYIYSENLLIEIIKYESDDSYTTKTVYKYTGKRPKWEEFYYYTGDKWQFQYAHGFEFDRNGNLTKKSSYQTPEKDKVYDQFIYKYKNARLVEEKRIIRNGETSYIKTFTYTPEGFPDEIISGENVIEKNFYDKGKLTEKHTFYFGIDPGFSACNGNFIYKYSY